MAVRQCYSWNVVEIKLALWSKRLMSCIKKYSEWTNFKYILKEYLLFAKNVLVSVKILQLEMF